MACCAFVAYLVSQLVLLLEGLGRLLGRPAAAPAQPAHLWRLDTVSATPRAVPAAAARHPWFRPRYALIGVLALVELLVALSGAQWFLFGRGAQLVAADFHRLAATGAITHLRDLCGL